MKDFLRMDFHKGPNKALQDDIELFFIEFRAIFIEKLPKGIMLCKL